MANQFSGTQIDGSKVRFWATKPQAIAAAKAIGWPANCVSRVHTRFQLGWALHKGGVGGHLSREEYDALHSEREAAMTARSSFTDVQFETAYGSTVRFSRLVRVF